MIPNDLAEELQGWVGRSEVSADVVTAAPLAALSATLDREDALPVPGTPLPPLWHWLFFTPRNRQRDLDIDGHVRRGGFLPPVPLPRRMWAGGRFEFAHALHVGDAVTRRSEITAVDVKQGRSGPLVFVTVRHAISNPRGVAIIEEQDLVYRDVPQAGAPVAAVQRGQEDAQFGRRITPDPVLLFRYSALTFNGHRIHYDRSYATEVEGYPGLVVHGPLIATLLIELLQRELPERAVQRFWFKAVRPLFDIHPFSVSGNAGPDGRVALRATDNEGALAMEAGAETTHAA